MSDIRVNIWRLQAQGDVAGLIAALTNADSDVRKRAAAALRTLDAREAVPALTKTLHEESDASTRAHIVAALEQLTDDMEAVAYNFPPLQDVVPADELEQNKVSRLIAQLGSSEAKQIIAAARQLGEINDKQAGEPLVMTFNHTDLPVKVRLVVAQTLLKLECAPTEVSLLGAIDHPDWETRRKAIAILGRLKADWALEPLSKKLSDPHPLVRRTAFAAIKHIGTPMALKIVNAFVKYQRTKTGMTPVVVEDEATPEAPATPTEEMMPESPKRKSALLARVNLVEDDVIADVAADVSADAAADAADDAPGDNNQSASTASKLAWPNRKPQNHTAFAPTRPLDPRTLDEYRRRQGNTGSDD